MWQPDPQRQRLANHTIEDLLTTPGDARYEVTDGILRVVPFHSARHQTCCALLAVWLRDHTPPHLTATHHMSVAFAIDSTREIDVLVRRVEASGTHVFLRPHEVKIAIEVEEPRSRHTDRVIKPAEYAAAAIPHFWRVALDPVHIHAFRLGTDGRYRPVADSGDVLTVDVPVPIRLPIADITP